MKKITTHLLLLNLLLCVSCSDSDIKSDLDIIGLKGNVKSITYRVCFNDTDSTMVGVDGPSNKYVINFTEDGMLADRTIYDKDEVIYEISVSYDEHNRIVELTEVNGEEGYNYCNSVVTYDSCEFSKDIEIYDCYGGIVKTCKGKLESNLTVEEIYYNSLGNIECKYVYVNENGVRVKSTLYYYDSEREDYDEGQVYYQAKLNADNVPIELIELQTVEIDGEYVDKYNRYTFEYNGCDLTMSTKCIYINYYDKIAGDAYDGTYKYKYEKFDSINNWIKRSVYNESDEYVLSTECEIEYYD